MFLSHFGGLFSSVEVREEHHHDCDTKSTLNVVLAMGAHAG